MFNNNDRVNLQVIFVPVVFSSYHVVTESKENLWDWLVNDACFSLNSKFVSLCMMDVSVFAPCFLLPLRKVQGRLKNKAPTDYVCKHFCSAEHCIACVASVL